MHISRHLLQLNSIDVEDNLQLADIGELQIAVLWVSDWGAGGSADQFSQADYHSYSFSSLFILFIFFVIINCAKNNDVNQSGEDEKMI